AALQGLNKMRFVRGLGVAQAVLPPHDRPSVSTLRRLGFTGADEQVIAAAGAGDGLYLRLCSSASSMWAANAATVAPSTDTADGRVHITPANLQHMFHRSIEAPTTTRVLRAVFADDARFVVHDPLPGGGQLSDEGAANHLRLETSRGAVHLFAWGRGGLAPERFARPRAYPARHTLEASQALARLHGLDPARCLFPQQHPAGIDDGAFHTDVLAVGSGRFLMLHELAFLDVDDLLDTLRRLLGDELVVVRASRGELPSADAVAAYPFNSQVVAVADGSLAVVAPEDSRDDPPSRAFLERVLSSGGPVRAIHYVDVRQSMRNGGGPACLRLRVPLSEAEAGALSGNVVLDDALEEALRGWIQRHYRDRLVPADLADPRLARDGLTALDELTRILRLGSIYDFQRA
ncbi:MAG TPA: N-succinylarginine dihydrolase, partial [Polyangiaceae bacterium]|nr:N-succinylarginine dihydrolase [Polyangiaceae bacterium]